MADMLPNTDFFGELDMFKYSAGEFEDAWRNVEISSPDKDLWSINTEFSTTVQDLSFKSPDSGVSGSNEENSPHLDSSQENSWLLPVSNICCGQEEQGTHLQPVCPLVVSQKTVPILEFSLQFPDHTYTKNFVSNLKGVMLGKDSSESSDTSCESNSVDKLETKSQSGKVRSITRAIGRKRSISSCDEEIVACKKEKRYEEMPSSDPEAEKKRKNALVAKQNRDRTKNYIAELEKENKQLKRKNYILESSNTTTQDEIINFKERVEYLENILVNESALAGVLNVLRQGNSSIVTVPETPLSSVRLTTSFNVSTGSAGKIGGGVCLHVDGSQVSLELCCQCSKMANGGGRPSRSTT